MSSQNIDDSLEIRPICNEKEYEEILDVRDAVFVREQNVEPRIEFDGLDEGALHVIVKFENKAIGCARVRVIDGKMKLERIAILKEHRNRGFGKRLMKYLISYCKQRDAKEIVMHAQYYLKDFYREFGFETRGEAFIEADIKHIEMYLR